MKNDYLLRILRSDQTIFTFKDVCLVWGQTDINYVKKKLHRYVKAGKLLAVRKGIYTKDQNYDPYELAVKIYTPAYISFETVLGAAGITFQYYNQIFVASYQSREIEIEGQHYAFLRIKESILTNLKGIDVRKNYSIATPERAFLDVLYRQKSYHFDNLGSLDWDSVYEILPIFGGNRRMGRTVNEHYQRSKRAAE